MKLRLLLPTLALFLGICSTSRATDAPFEISIAIPGSLEGPALVRENKQSHFHVILTNITDTTQEILETNNSWGYDALGFELTDAQGRKTTAIRRPIYGWTRNFPNTWLLPPHASHVFDIYYSDPEQWQGFSPSKSRDGRAYYTIRAMYTSPSLDQESEFIKSKVHPWAGTLTSAPVKFFFFWKTP